MTPQAVQVSPTGIAGLDAILRGGLPTGRSTLVVGGPGAGKTVLAMQFLVNGAACYGEMGVMVSFEESERAMRTNFGTLDWPFAEVLGTKLLILDGRLPPDTVEAGTFDLAGLIAVLDALVKTRGVKRVALDGIDMLFDYSRHETVSRREVRRLLNWLTDANVTALVTVKAAEGRLGVQSYLEFAEFAADGVMHLANRLSDQFLIRGLHVVKMRGASFVSGEHPFVIAETGLEFAYTDQTKAAMHVTSERLSSGVERLDRMLHGGYREGTVTLISGPPGTSKTTLAGCFVSAGCARGLSALFIGFDEPVEQVFLDLRSVGVQLERYRDAGLLASASLNAGAAGADEHYLTIERLVELHQPRLLVIDPMSAFVKAGGRRIADIVSERLVNLVKARGITTLFTAVADSDLGELESSASRVSTIADNWIHVSFAARRGERNRMLTVVKARGTGHSNQMRELILSDDGLDLKDVYYALGEVLLGTARVEKEQQEANDARLRESQNKRALAEVDEHCRALEAQLERTRFELAGVIDERRRIALQASEVERSLGADQAAILASRGEDPDPGVTANGAPSRFPA